MKNSKQTVDIGDSSSVTDRLLQFIKKKGVKRDDFYSLTGIGSGTLDKKGGMTTNNLKKVLEIYPDLNLYWLVTGKDKIDEKSHVVTEKSQPTPELFDAYRKLNEVRNRLEESELALKEAYEDIRLKDAKISELQREIIELHRRDNFNLKDIA